jgi:hypothetical protein
VINISSNISILSHNQLYVAISRVSWRESLKILITGEDNMWFIDFFLEIHEKLCWQWIYEKTFLFSYTVVFEIVLLYIYSVIYSTPSDYYYKQNTTFKFIRK